MRRLYYFPFVLSIYPALSLLSTNITQVGLISILRSVVVSVVITSLVYFLLYVVYRTPLRAAILTAIFMLFFFSYGHIYHLIRNAWMLGFHVGRHRYLLAAWILIFILSVIWLRKPRPYFHLIGNALNVASILLIFISVFQIMTSVWNSVDLDSYDSSIVASDSQLFPGDLEGGQISEGSPLPDIYYIILDMYTRQDILANTFSYDNRPFVEQLEEFGFYVASCSQSNYDSTVTSLSSSLNMDYFQNLFKGEYDEDMSPYSFGEIVKDNRVRKFLQNLDYTIIALESGFSPTEWDDSVEYREVKKDLFDLAFGGLNPFESMFLRTTPGILLYGYFDRLPDAVRTGLDSAYIQHRERILFELNEIKEITEYPGPKFVFVHILAPHNPFVFGPNGEFIRRDTLFTLNADLESDTWEEFASGYTGQIAYINTRMMEIVTYILTNSDSPPIIIIQGDHGVPKLEYPMGKVAILNAYYLPKEGANGLYPTISPVNSFRLILNTYFGMNYGLLDDVSYIVPNKEKPLAFQNVPNSEGSCLFEE